MKTLWDRARIALLVVSVFGAVCSTFAPSNVVAQDDLARIIAAVAWSPNGDILAFGRADGVLEIWDAGTNRLLQTLRGHTASVTSVAWSPDGQQLVSGSADETIRVWNTSDGQLVMTLTGHGEIVRAVAWSPDGKRIASGSFEIRPSLRIWDAATGALLSGHDAGSMAEIAWSHDGGKLALLGYSGALQISDAQTLQPLAFFEARYGFMNQGYAMAWSLNDAYIAVGNAEGIITVYDVATERVLATLQSTDRKSTQLEEIVVRSIAFSVDGRKILSVNADGTMRVWDIETQELLATVQKQSPIYAAEWSTYRGRVAFGGFDEMLTASRNFAAGRLEVAAPFPTTEELGAIANSCVQQAEFKRMLITQLDRNQLAMFVNGVRDAPREHIPPACAADLIAVAEALQAAN